MRQKILSVGCPSRLLKGRSSCSVGHIQSDQYASYIFMHCDAILGICNQVPYKLPKRNLWGLN